MGPRRPGACKWQLLTLPGGPCAVPVAAFRIPRSPTYPDSLHCGLGSALPSDPPRPTPANNFKQRGHSQVGSPTPRSPSGQPRPPPPPPATLLPGASPKDLGGRWGKGRSSERREQREGAAGEGREPPFPRLRAGRRGRGCTCRGGTRGRRQSGWLSRVEARRAPIPAACSPRGLQRAHRRHRQRRGFIYPDGRARPGNRNSEVFSCFLTAQPSRRTSCGRGIHVPGPERGSHRRDLC